MTVTEESRYHLHQRLEEVLGHEDATTLMEHLPPVGWADVATKQDLALLRSEVGHDITRLGAELRKDMAAMGAELRKEMGAMGAELRKETAGIGAELRKEMTGMESGLRRDMSGLATKRDLWALASLMVALFGVFSGLALAVG